MSILLLLAVFALTVFLQGWLHRHIQAFAMALTGNPGCAVRLLFYLLWPGVVMHESSHFLAARLLRVRTGGMRVGLGRAHKRRITLGWVNVARTDPVRESLIGVAPFVVGVTAIWLLAGIGFGLWPNSALAPEQILTRLDAFSADWTRWLDAYLIFAVSTAMIPSESDREPWGPVVTVFGLGVAILLLMGWAPQVPLDFMHAARQLLDALTFALGVAVVVNGLVGCVLWFLEQAVGRFSRRRARYAARRR